MKNTICTALLSISLLSGCAIDTSLKLPDPNYTNKQFVIAEAEEIAINLVNSGKTNIKSYVRQFDYNQETKILTEVNKLLKSRWFWTLNKSEVDEYALTQACSSGLRKVIDGGIAYRSVYIGDGGVASDVVDSASCGRYDRTAKK